jgi:uncharacterized protein YfdQ (DUF2303 family)
MSAQQIDEKKLERAIRKIKHCLALAQSANENEAATVDDEGKAIPVAKANAAVRTITVKATSESESTVGETSASRSAMDQIEARSKETLPAALLFSTIPYEGLIEQQINLRISIITSGAQPALKLRWVGEEVQREDIAKEFKTVLPEKIGRAAALSLGAFDPK